MPFYRFIAFQRLTLLNALFCAVILGVFPAIASANEAPATVKPSDVRMIIDISGSMKKNDPSNLRRPAIDMLVKLLPKGSKAGVWSFGKTVSALVPHKNIDPQWSKKAAGAATKINSVAQFTNIGAALERAAYDAQQGTNDYQKHVILLTDGMVDISRDPTSNEQERQRIIDHVLPLYQRTGFTLHTIALSDNADKQLLDKLALETDGKAAVAKTADELMAVLLSVFDQAVPAEQAPFDGESFIVDSSIEEFTALIFRKQGSADAKIMGPDGTVYTKDKTDQYVKWYHTDAYDLITVQKPLEGEWRVDADVEPQSRITVVSDLKLLVAPMPRNIMVDETVETTVAFQEEGKIVTRVEFLGLLDIDMAITAPDGSSDTQRISQNLVPVDGLYPAKVEGFSEEGEYAIEFMVDGKSFSRKFSHTISVRKPLKAEVNNVGKAGSSEFVVQVIPQVRSIDVKKSQIEAMLKTPDGSQRIIDFTLAADGKWQTTVKLKKSGEHQLSFSPQVIDKDGKSISAELDSVLLSNGSSPLVQKPKEDKPVVPVLLDDVPVVQQAEENVAVQEEPQEQAEQAEEESPLMDYILYAVIAVVNLLIIAIIAIIYRKLFKKKPEESEVAETDIEDDLDLSEPPMDEMSVDEMDDEVEPIPEPEVPPSPEEGVAENDSQEASEDNDNIMEGMDDEDINLDEDDPNFSLDEFSPESLDDDDVSDFDEEKKE